MSLTRCRLFVSAVTLLLAALGLPALFAGAIRGAEVSEEVAAAIAQQEQALDGIETLYAKATAYHVHGDERHTMQEVEWFRAGKNERFATVSFLQPHVQEDGTTTYERFDPAQRTETAFAGEDYRLLEQWDSDAAVNVLRLTPQNRATYASVYGTVMESANAWSLLHYQLMLAPGPGYDLSKLAEEAKSVTVVSKTDDALTLDFVGEMFGAKNLRGTITLSPKQRHLVRRTEWRTDAADAEPTTVIEAEIQDFGEGRFLPTKVTTSQAGKVVMEISLTDVAIDDGMDPVRATVRFPEGIKVDRMKNNQLVEFYLWGESDKPAMTFETQQARERWLMDELRGAKRE